MFKTPLEKLAFRIMVLFGLTVILGRFTHGLVMGVYVLLGCFWAAKRQTAWAMATYLFLGCAMFINPNLMPRMNIAALIMRIGFFALGFQIAITSAAFRSSRTLPLAMMFLYLLCAAISSVGGWSPIVSYMKIVFFATFVFSVLLGARGFVDRPGEILRFRAVLLGFALFLVFGSLAVLPFPEIAYMTSMKYQLREFGAEVAVEMFKEQAAANEEMRALFGGITNHSQAFSPVLAATGAWALCDMLFVERRFDWMHLSIIGLSIPMLYMTRSRLALLVLVVTCGAVIFYLLNVIHVSQRVKARATAVMILGTLVLIVAAFVVQSRNQGMSKWLRKTQNLRGDNRGLGEAVTESRMEAVELMMEDYRRNSFLGMGFQVSPFVRDMVKHSRGLIFSAPIEKGILPLMVLSETGILGSAAFVVFLICFYAGCSRKKLRTTATLFTVLLATNMGEATFFSPGNTGGVLWIVCVLGGYVIDLSVLGGERMWMSQPRMMR